MTLTHNRVLTKEEVVANHCQQRGASPSPPPRWCVSRSLLRNLAFGHYFPRSRCASGKARLEEDQSTSYRNLVSGTRQNAAVLVCAPLGEQTHSTIGIALRSTKPNKIIDSINSIATEASQPPVRMRQQSAIQLLPQSIISILATMPSTHPLDLAGATPNWSPTMPAWPRATRRRSDQQCLNIENPLRFLAWSSRRRRPANTLNQSPNALMKEHSNLPPTLDAKEGQRPRLHQSRPKILLNRRELLLPTLCRPLSESEAIILRNCGYPCSALGLHLVVPPAHPGRSNAPMGGIIATPITPDQRSGSIPAALNVEAIQ